jgi:hypothetical protein
MMDLTIAWFYALMDFTIARFYALMCVSYDYPSAPFLRVISTFDHFVV